MTAPLLPHLPLGSLFGLIEVMADTPGPDDLYRLADRLRLGLDELHPLLEAAQLLGWGRVERGDYELTDEGPLIAAILRALAPGAPVPRRTVLNELRTNVTPFEAERQVDTAVNWGRWAQLFDCDADDECFLPPRDDHTARPL